MEPEHSPGDGGMLKAVTPFIAAGAVVITGTVLIAAIYFTLFDLEWVAFLGGVLMASILAMAARAARAEVAAANRGGRLLLAEYRLTGEGERRDKLEKQLAAANARLRYSDEQLPVMLAFVDQDTRYRFHNHAFRSWHGLQESKIDGQHMRDVLGRKVFMEVEPYVQAAAAGRLVRYERTHKAPSGALFRIAVQYLPQFGTDGIYAGVYVVITDVTERRDVEVSAAASAEAASDEAAGAESQEWHDESRRILAAINGNEFVLFCQKIVPLAADAAGSEHHEVLIRLQEEESSTIPPGAFFPLAAEHGLLPQLDRWVLAHVLDWMGTPVGAGTVAAGEIYFINIASATISDPEFPDFVEQQLRRTGVRASAVCLEIDEADLNRNQGDAVAFARAIRHCGCLIAISGFGRLCLSMETLRLFPVDFLKIDGGIVRQILAYPAVLGKLVAISKLAKAIGVRTVAEMVEDDPTLAMLRKLNVNFAQGFGISRPRLLADLKVPAALDAPRGAPVVLPA